MTADDLCLVIKDVALAHSLETPGPMSHSCCCSELSQCLHGSHYCKTEAPVTFTL